MLKDLIMKCRSYRRFDESHAISKETLLSLVELARFSPTGANMQPLKFMLVNEKAKNEKIFPHIAWAGTLKDWCGPVAGERPTAYIVILGDTTIAKNFGLNHGICAQSMMLGAVEQGLGGCMIGAFNKEGVQNALAVPEQYEVLLLLALGKPIETVVIDDMNAGDSFAYYRDEKQVHHVPKRKLEDLCICD